MASMQDGVNFSTPPYGEVLLLGAIAAASAFVVTILIVLLCVGCQRKGKSSNAPTEGTKHRIVDMSRLRQSKLRSISKSDTKLHQMIKPNCNGKSASKSRPASMDLLLLPGRRRRSNTDLRSASSRQLPQVPLGGGEGGEHPYTEVGPHAPPAPPRRGDDALYEMVGGRAGDTDTPAPPAPANTPAPHSPEHDGDGEERVGTEASAAAMLPPPLEVAAAEYACVRKVRKVDKPPRKESGPDSGEKEQQRRSNTDLHHAPPLPHHAPPLPHHAPPLPHPQSQKVPRKTIEPFHLHSFPKEAVFMGNGEEYIWKPPEDEDLVLHQPKGPCPLTAPGGEAQSAAGGVSELYSKVCKPPKKKRLVPSSPPGLAKECEGPRNAAGFSVVVKPQTWGAAAGGSHPGPLDEPCYEAIGERAWPGEPEPAFEAVDSGWRRSGERLPNATLRPKKKKPAQPPQPPLFPAKTLPGPGENLYESIGELKQGGASSSTTTIFTFNDGMEMYVTGL